MAGAGGDQRDRDRLRAQPQRVLGRRAGLDAVHPLLLGGLRRRRQRRRRKDPYNPVDAIFAAARYLKAAGGDKDIRKAIFAYNHANWYVDSVMLRAKLIGGLPDDLVGSITGLTEGRFPVAARATYADDLDRARDALKRVASRATPPMSVNATPTGAPSTSSPARRAGRSPSTTA